MLTFDRSIKIMPQRSKHRRVPNTAAADESKTHLSLCDYLIHGFEKPAVKNQTQFWQIKRASADSQLGAGSSLHCHQIPAAAEP